MLKHTVASPNAAPAPTQWMPREDVHVRGGAELTTVSRVMRRAVETVTPETSLETVTEMMLRSGASSFPVVDEDGHVVGIVSKTDVLADHLLHGDTQEVETPALPLRHGVAYRETGVHVHEPVATVWDVMTRSVVVVPETASVAETCALMAVNHVHGIPVVAADGRVAGMVETLDVLGWVAGLS